MADMIKEMEMLEAMVLGGASPTQVLSIGFSGYDSSGVGSGGGSSGGGDGELSDEEFHQLFEVTTANLFASIYSMLGGDASSVQNSGDLASLIFDAMYGGIGGSGSGGTDGGTPQYTRDDVFGPLTGGPTRWKAPENWILANRKVLSMQPGTVIDDLHINKNDEGYWTLKSDDAPNRMYYLVRGPNGWYYWAVPDKYGKLPDPGYKISITVHDATGDHVIDIISGSDGNDLISGSGYLSGDDGDDAITGSAKGDVLKGGSGNDWLDGGAGGDVIDGGAGWDVNSHMSATSGVIIDLTTNINGGAAAGTKIFNVEVLQGSNHNDRLTGIDNGNGHGVQLYGEGGDDALTGKGGGDYLFGGTGNDWLDGGAGGDNIDGGAGWDVNSHLSATSGVIIDLTTNLNGGAAAGDTIVNIEVLQGSNFADSLTGIDNGGGNGVQLYGEGGNDTLLGKGGGDYLFGGTGSDWLDSGFGCDVLNGGDGLDYFAFSSALGAGNVDTVQDFAAGDTLALSYGVFAQAGSYNLAGTAFKLGTAATTAAHRIVYNQASGDLFYDADGVGGAAQVKFAIIANHAQLSAANFLVW
jgi:Ca2+-binding RTX toxin-like protein